MKICNFIQLLPSQGISYTTVIYVHHGRHIKDGAAGDEALLVLLKYSKYTQIHHIFSYLNCVFAGMEHHLPQLAHFCAVAVGVCAVDDPQPARSNASVFPLPCHICRGQCSFLSCHAISFHVISLTFVSLYLLLCRNIPFLVFLLSSSYNLPFN